MDNNTFKIKVDNENITFNIKTLQDCNIVIVSKEDIIEFLIKEYVNLSNKNKIIYFDKNNIKNNIKNNYKEDIDNINNGKAYNLKYDNSLYNMIQNINSKNAKEIVNFINSDFDNRKILLNIFNNRNIIITTSLGDIIIKDNKKEVIILFNGVIVATINNDNMTNYNNNSYLNNYDIENVDEKTIDEILKDIEY